jgi:K+-sensing histidine kinase KdpD
MKLNRLALPSPPAIVGYGAAVLSVAAALGIVWWMQTVQLPAAHVSLFLCAVMFSAWFGGARPGLVAIALSALAFAYFLPPNRSFAVESAQLPRLFLYVLSAFFVGALTAAQRSAAQSLRQLLNRLCRAGALAPGQYALTRPLDSFADRRGFQPSFPRPGRQP